MEFPFTREEWEEILIHLYKRASIDHQFHLLCIQDSHMAIKLISGKEIPSHFKIRFETQHPHEMILILPLENKVLLRELSDQDLERLARGMATASLP